MTHFHVITLFPKAFDSYLNESILKRALEDKKMKVSFYNPRDFTKDKYKRIDRPPYAGGPGMVIQAEPVARAIDEALRRIKIQDLRFKNKTIPKSRILSPKSKIIWLSPSGNQFDNTYAKKVAKGCKHVIIVCGRYEGIDARVKKVFSTRGGSAFGGKVDEISVGPFILTGGELPAMIIIDAVARQVPGVLGNADSIEEHRVSTSQVYTRPEVFSYTPPGRGKKAKKYRVPKVLLSGHQAKIEEWKRDKNK